MDHYKQDVAERAKAEMLRLWEEAETLNRKIDYQRRLLDTHCQHVDVAVRSKYVEGGYDRVSQIQITHICTLCNKLLKSYNDPHHKGSYA